ncbi:hypothetical protein LOTGIDRAFT_167954 [Lottia gigantea]|uniref:Sema domain-containing protein n=1 Tax=Lottia gigantea TaxID=225164 RepID=V3ZLJ4_LOTGI|nr:hypothetical protein LOTGIDRAFT_167954 [Lottia gigantea]ESO85167.1 hypothetical protein LOTGIDRAFT_167954 [Lottia gigantea]
MYVVHHFLLVFLVGTQWTTFTNGLIINVTKISFKPTSIAVDNITGNVYAAGSFYLARLNSNLKQLNQIKICKTCKSRILEIDYRTRKLLVCGVSDKGSCTYHNLNNISNFTMLTSQNNKGDSVGSNGSVVALFLPPSQRKHSELVMGISQPLENQIDLLSFRKIASGHLTYLPSGSHGKLRISDEFRKDVKVHFVYGFQFKDGLYFLVNKRGKNGTSSWLFRIWYNETSVYPFTAIPISCTEKRSEGNIKTPEKKYNLAIAGKLYEHPSHESLVVSFGYNRDKGTHIPDEKFGSSVCMFRMEEITKDMNIVSSKCGLETFVTASGWIIGHGTVGYNDMTNSSCKPGYNNALEGIEEGRDFNPVKVVKNQLITSVIPFPVDGRLHIIISTNYGQLYYYHRTRDEKYWFQIPNEKNIRGFLADVEINTKTKTAYTITENKVVKISLDYCQKNLNCSACVQDSKFMCVWFKGQCFATDRNTGGLENTCLPEITSGKARELTDLSNCVQYHVLSTMHFQPLKIVCKTESASKEEKCAVTVSINDTESSPYMKGSVNSGNNSKLHFYFKSASITSFNPELGPESGGTNITVIGENLDLTKRVDIKIKDLSLQCQIRSGGLDVNVEGTNLNVIANPRLVITLDNGEIESEAEDCIVRSSTTMICKTPKLTSVVPDDTFISGDIYFIMDGVRELRDFAKTHPNLSQIKVNPDPEFSSVSKDGLVDSLENALSIKGTNIKESEVDSEDIQVTLTSNAGTNITCPVIKLGEEAVSCRPKLTSAVNEIQLVVRVKVGNRYYKVGNIFVNAKGKIPPGVPDLTQNTKQYAIIVGVVSAVVVCIILIILVIPVLYNKFLQNFNVPQNQGFNFLMRNT